MDHILSIVTVNWKSDDFLKVLKESATLTSVPYEFICIDNSINNIGHGEGLNAGAAQATGKYVMFVDVDCHFLKLGWEQPILKLLESCDVVAGKGVPVKPIRPACMCLKTEIAKKYNWAASPGYKGHRITPTGFDVAIKAYYQMRGDNVKIDYMHPLPNRYGTLNGEEFSINQEPLVYHHWHGTHLKERSVDFPGIDLFADKDKLFKALLP
mgnify:CR=1 FL=1